MQSISKSMKMKSLHSFYWVAVGNISYKTIQNTSINDTQSATKERHLTTTRGIGPHYNATILEMQLYQREKPASLFVHPVS